MNPVARVGTGARRPPRNVQLLTGQLGRCAIRMNGPCKGTQSAKRKQSRLLDGRLALINSAEGLGQQRRAHGIYRGCEYANENKSTFCAHGLHAALT